MSKYYCISYYEFSLLTTLDNATFKRHVKVHFTHKKVVLFCMKLRRDHHVEIMVLSRKSDSVRIYT